ncbi:hypothetical protein UMM65_15965 [Aureibaculum sp. 2210JD6-5]|uniref:hypothetical protein n=1 Tax=Aureibaculum sp. 2210JD6-5 TaxID=3103957 RepID=UPI002AAE4961|nr:hypothetical protein [Aureibaculum sp. 2210JD6-5]MDY7396745.1 hypothetical protein [Aureibaculum sp. 2210JD6-5]
MSLKKFEVYRNMRKQAEIMGLSISLFALMMTSIIGSFMVIIFSFDFIVILTALIFNIVLYIALVYLTKNPSHFYFRKVFPKTISNKKACLSLTEGFSKKENY